MSEDSTCNVLQDTEIKYFSALEGEVFLYTVFVVFVGDGQHTWFANGR